jgi:hypothetical protein
METINNCTTCVRGSDIWANSPICKDCISKSTSPNPFPNFTAKDSIQNLNSNSRKEDDSYGE